MVWWKCGKSTRAKKAEANKKKTFNTITGSRQDKKFFISELFKVIQGRNSHWILHYRDNVLIPKRFSSSTFITSDVRSIYTPSWIQDWLQGGQNVSKRQDGISLRLWILLTKNTEIPDVIDLDATASCLVQTEKKRGKKHQKHCAIGSTSNLLKNKGLKVLSKRDRNAIILYNTLPAYCIPKAISDGKLKKSYTRKVYASPLPPLKISWKDNWMKRIGNQNFAGGGKRLPDTMQPKDQKIQLFRNRATCCGQNKKTSLFECSGKSIHVFSLDCENTNLFVETFWRKTKKNVDADQNKKRWDLWVGSRKNFRVRENSWRRSRVSSSTSTSKPICNKNNAYKPIQWRIESNDSWKWGNVRAIRVMRKTIPKVQMLRNGFSLLENKGNRLLPLVGHLLKESENQPTFSPINDWMLFSIKKKLTSSRRRRPSWWLGTAKTEAQKDHFRDPQFAEEMSSKRNWWEFTIASNEIQYNRPPSSEEY